MGCGRAQRARQDCGLRPRQVHRQLQLYQHTMRHPAYVAPEVLVNQQNRRYNRAVDMWSVGVLLYVCLCGFPPFSEELGPPSMRQQIIEARYAFFSPYWDDIADDALDLISRLLVADPNRRLSVEQALRHPWLRDCAESLELAHA